MLDLPLAHGGDVDWCDSENTTILDNPVMFQARDSVMKLLALGKRLNYRNVNSFGQIVLHISGIAANEDIMTVSFLSGHVGAINED